MDTCLQILKFLVPKIFIKRNILTPWSNDIVLGKRQKEARTSLYSIHKILLSNQKLTNENWFWKTSKSPALRVFSQDGFKRVNFVLINSVTNHPNHLAKPS